MLQTISIALLAALVYISPAVRPVEAPEPERVSVQLQKIDFDTKNALLDKDALDVWIDDLAYCESRNNPMVVNHNDGAPGLHSRGLFQFQMPTFRHYVRMYGMAPNTEDAELENLIWDGDFQRRLVRRMIESRYENWNHWYVCSTEWIGRPPKDW